MDLQEFLEDEMIILVALDDTGGGEINPGTRSKPFKTAISSKAVCDRNTFQ